MKKTTLVWFVAAAALAVCATSCLSTLESLTGKLGESTPRVTNEEAVAAMREALKEGASSASAQLSAKDGYFGNVALKILLPPEAKTLVDSVGKIPQGQKLIDDVVLRINRAAEESAKEVVPIFVKAVTEMTIGDAIAILKGGDTSATEYLKSKTRKPLADLYRPKVAAALSKPLVMNVSASKAWETLTGAYNKAGQIPNGAARFAGKKEPMPAVQVDLATYATDRALDGLFVKIGEEEQKIRKNPLGYASAVIQKVFGALRSGLL